MRTQAEVAKEANGSTVEDRAERQMGMAEFMEQMKTAEDRSRNSERRGPPQSVYCRSPK